jgi:hypothetical protein
VQDVKTDTNKMNIIQNFSDSDLEKFEAKAQNETFFKSFRNYRRFIEVVYLIPDFENIDTPQWAHVAQMLKTDAGTWLLVRIFNDENDFLNIETVLKYPFVTINDTKFNNGNRNFHNLVK